MRRSISHNVEGNRWGFSYWPKSENAVAVVVMQLAPDYRSQCMLSDQFLSTVQRASERCNRYVGSELAISTIIASCNVSSIELDVSQRSVRNEIYWPGPVRPAELRPGPARPVFNPKISTQPDPARCATARARSSPLCHKF